MRLSTKSKLNTKNKGFIAMTISVWAVLVLTTIVSLESQWLSVLIDQRFYKNEMLRLEQAANRCLEISYNIYISGITNEEFVWHIDDIDCYGRTGDISEVITTTSRFWYKKSKNFI